VRLARKRPNLLDASFVHIQLTSDVFKKMLAEGLSGATLSPMEQQQYRVIIMVDGNTVPDRFAAQLLSGPAVVRQESAHHEYWSEELIPWVHYIPVREDLEDLEETLDRVLANATLLMSVSAAARNFVFDRLSPATIRRYWSEVLGLYSQHMRGAIVPANGSRLIDPPVHLPMIPGSWTGLFSLKSDHPPMSFGFTRPEPQVTHCQSTSQPHHSSLQHKCSAWKGSKATEFACVVYQHDLP
jgi:hypothetical protein